MRKIEIKFTNRWLYTFALIIGIFALAVGVYAYNSGGPASVVGHSTDELEGVCLTDGTNCPSGAVDTRCDVSGTCTQVCIGTDCQTVWPSGGGLAGYRSNTGTSCTNSDDAVVAKKWVAVTSIVSDTNCPASTCTSSNMWLLSSDPAPSCSKYICPAGPDFPCVGGTGCTSGTVNYAVSAVACVGDA